MRGANAERSSNPRIQRSDQPLEFMWDACQTGLVGEIGGSKQRLSKLRRGSDPDQSMLQLKFQQSQGLMLAKLLPTEKIVSCCTYHDGENIFLISKQGKIFCINSNEIYCSNEYSLGYLNEKTQLKNDYFLKIMASNHYLDIETNKNKSARLDLNKLNFKSNKSNFLIDFLKLDNDEYLENCFRLENFLN